MQEIARANGITTEIEERQYVPGWEGAAKGVLQILWERGFINPDCVDRYTMHGTTDDEGNINLEYSMLYLIESCLDFAFEITQLQYIGRLLGAEVYITPKFHAEVAGEGVEYSWALSKSHYRRLPLRLKKTRKEFKELVKASIARNIVTTERTRKFSRRARAYICACRAFHDMKKEEHDPNERTNYPLSLPAIEKMVKDFKTHRSALDFDRGFITSVLQVIE